YVHGLGLTSRMDASGAVYYDFDAIGSTAGLSGPAGSYLDSYSYLSFWGEFRTHATFANGFTYFRPVGGMPERNGMDFMRERFYTPVEGRFVGIDPLRITASIGIYAYARNDPVTWVDPNGLSPTCDAVRQFDQQAQDNPGTTPWEWAKAAREN